MDDFNDAAKPKKTARESLLESIAATRTSIGLAESAQKQDWTAAARFQAQGGDIEHREKAALKALVASDDIAVADIMESTDSLRYPPLMTYTLVRAAEKGNTATIAHIIAKKPSLDMLNIAACTALMSKQDTAADLLLKAIPETELGNNALFGLLVARPEEYERLVALPDRSKAPDYLMHFLNACHFKNNAAIDRSLDKMVAHVEETRRNIQRADMNFMDMGGSMLHEMTAHVFESGHLGAIDKFIDTFRNDMMPNFLLLHVALTVAGTQPEVFAHIAGKLGVKSEEVSAMLLHGAAPERSAAARYLIDTDPEAVKVDSFGVLRCFAGGSKPQDFFDALNAGIPLPADEKERAQLLATALEAKNETVAAHLEAAIGTLTAAQVAVLQKNTSTEVMLRSAQLSGDWRFKGDALYWRAATDGRQDILDTIPKDGPLSAALPYQLEYALEAAIKRDDKALIDDLMARTPWTDELKDKAVGAFMASPQYLSLIDTLGYAPRPLTDSDVHDIMHGKGAETIGALLDRGFTMDEKVEAAALEIAVKQNERATIEYLLGRSADMEAAPRLSTMIDLYAEPETLGQLEKWLRRDEVIPAPGLRARIAATAPAETFSLGVEATYADVFGAVMQKTAQDNAANFDPAALARTKDAYGNSVLDILGAHGKLNDILVPELWRDKDAVTFVRDNVPPCYLEQCDFNGLKASLDLLRLKDLGRRARIGLKGP